jgi:hypothetical protein
MAQLLSFLRESDIMPVQQGVLVDTWAVHPATTLSTCPLIFTMDGERARAHGLNLMEGGYTGIIAHEPVCM